MHVLIFGENVCCDNELLSGLKKRFSVETVRNEEKLREIIEDHSFQLLILEISESWEQDLEVVEFIDSLYPYIPIIVVGNNELPEPIISVFRSGAVDYFKRPYSVGLLIERIEALLKNYKKYKN